MIKKYKRRPLFVEATQFSGWNDVEDIRKWAKSGNVLYVPVGAAHQHRTTDEVDWEKGQLNPDAAPEFLLVDTPDGERRADIGDFILLAQDGDVYVVDADTFNGVYEEDTVDPFSKLKTDQKVSSAQTMVAAK